MESGMPHDIKRMTVEDLHKLNEKHSEATTQAAVNADKKNGLMKGQWGFMSSPETAKTDQPPQVVTNIQPQTLSQASSDANPPSTEGRPSAPLPGAAQGATHSSAPQQPTTSPQLSQNTIAAREDMARMDAASQLMERAEGKGGSAAEGQGGGDPSQ